MSQNCDRDREIDAKIRASRFLQPLTQVKQRRFSFITTPPLAGTWFCEVVDSIKKANADGDTHFSAISGPEFPETGRPAADPAAPPYQSTSPTRWRASRASTPAARSGASTISATFRRGNRS